MAAPTLVYQTTSEQLISTQSAAFGANDALCFVKNVSTSKYEIAFCDVREKAIIIYASLCGHDDVTLTRFCII